MAHLSDHHAPSQSMSALLGMEGVRKAILLSTLAGLSTGIGGILAIVRRPNQALLAALLGLAIGVMGSLSVIELLLRNAYEHGSVFIPFSMFLGCLAYLLLQPYLPNFEASSYTLLGKVTTHTSMALLSEDDQPRGQTVDHEASERPVSREAEKPIGSYAQTNRAADLMRLGLLMALTMTLHNLPEGFAVAFSSFTDFGPYMAAAIAVHNIPEGVIVAAPVYAATGSRWKSVAIALASGLSEPLGAIIAVIAVKPFISEEPLHYILAFVGGIMLAVCCLELWPEARRCKEDRQLYQGCVLGAIIMLATLAAGI